MKLYNHKGNLVNISTNLEANSPETKYKLEVVAAHCGHCGMHPAPLESVSMICNFYIVFLSHMSNNYITFFILAFFTLTLFSDFFDSVDVIDL